MSRPFGPGTGIVTLRLGMWPWPGWCCCGNAWRPCWEGSCGGCWAKGELSLEVAVGDRVPGRL